MQSLVPQADNTAPVPKRRREEPLLADAAPHGTVTFNGPDVTFSQHIKRPPAGRELRVYTSTTSICVSGLVQCEGMQIHQRHSANRQDFITVVIPLPIVLKLPVLKDLWEVTVPQADSQNEVPATQAAESSLKGAQARTAPFTPPVSIWALVSLVLVLEDKVDLWSLFGNVDTDPRLAAHTMLVRARCCSAPWTLCLATVPPAHQLTPLIGLKAMMYSVSVIRRDWISVVRDRYTVCMHAMPTVAMESRPAFSA